MTERGWECRTEARRGVTRKQLENYPQKLNDKTLFKIFKGFTHQIYICPADCEHSKISHFQFSPIAVSNCVETQGNLECHRNAERDHRKGREEVWQEVQEVRIGLVA